MALGLSAPGWFDNTWSVSAPGDSTVAGQTANTVNGNDQWSGFWQGLVGYAIQRDQNKQAAKAQASVAAAAVTPVYVSQPAAQTNFLPVVLIGVAVVGVVLLATRK